MDNYEIMQLLQEAGAIITDSHIVYTSGRHGTAYINKDALYVHTQITSRLCEIMASNYQADEVDLVAGPTVGGVILSQWTAHHLTCMRTIGETLSVYAEEEGEGESKIRIFKRGYDLLIAEKKVLIVEDVLTTGGSARKVIEAVRKLGGLVLGLSVLCNRGGIKPEDVGNVPLHALANVTLESWAEEECQLCKQEIPINQNVGKGKAFLAKKTAKFC